MVDEHLPFEGRDRPLRYLFLDLNAYFASVEQQERPELRGRPVAVAPMLADTTFVIAASYEAKRFGVKCGTSVREAKEKCPGIEIVAARAPVYVAYHRRILEVLEKVLPIDHVCSIDEMQFRLMGTERTPAVAREIAMQMKRAVRENVGQHLGCSVGIAPNAFLAKIATEIQKPDGLVVLQADDLPTRLLPLKLTDLTGINRRMQARLHAAGIFTVEELCRRSRNELRTAFGSVVGERWWYLLRGHDLEPEVRSRKTLGHSHVLSPARRTDQGCREVLMRLLQKASARLRSERLWTGGMSVAVRGFDRSWEAKIRLPPTQDTIILNEHFLREWEARDFARPRSVGVTFYDLRPAEQVTPSLFEPTSHRSELNHTIDSMNRRFGKNKIFLAGMERAKDTAHEKIAFNKTWLFSEGAGDNEWVDTFRGLRE